MPPPVGLGGDTARSARGIHRGNPCVLSPICPVHARGTIRLGSFVGARLEGGHGVLHTTRHYYTKRGAVVAMHEAVAVRVEWE